MIVPIALLFLSFKQKPTENKNYTSCNEEMWNTGREEVMIEMGIFFLFVCF